MTTGLQNNLNRWYDAEIGSWLNEDLIGFEGGDANLYRYCGNDPVNGTDPAGTIVPWLARGLVGGAIGLTSYAVGCWWSGEEMTLAGGAKAFAGGAIAGLLFQPILGATGNTFLAGFGSAGLAGSADSALSQWLPLCADASLSRAPIRPEAERAEGAFEGGLL